MRFEKIVIKNFRQYQDLSFDFPKGDHDLHVIVAQNGVGKTNLLNAITWCLYEKEPHLGDDSPDKGLPRLNLRAIDDARNAGSSSADVSVQIYAEHDGERIIYERTEPYKITEDKYFASKSQLIVTTSKGKDSIIHEGEDAVNYVEKYMPQKIREYFFFDGEQLNSYFVNQGSSVIKDAIFSISQVDMVHRIAERLEAVISTRKKSAGAKVPKIKEITAALDEAKSQEKAAKDDIEKIEDQIAFSRTRVQEITETLRGKENLMELEKKYEELNSKRQELKEKLRKCNVLLVQFVREAKVALTYYTAAKYTVDLIDKKRAEHALPPDIDKNLLKRMLIEHRCAVCEHDLTKEEEEHVERLLEMIQVSSETSNILAGVYDELVKVITEAESYQERKNEILDQRRSIEDEITGCEQDIGDLQIQLGKIPDKEEARALYAEREHLLGDIIEENLKKQGAAQHRLQLAHEKVASLDGKLSQELAKESECKQLKQQIDFADTAKAIMMAVETEIMTEVRQRMEEKTTEFFRRLVWKKNTYDRVLLDENYRLDLLHVDGYSAFGTCSATERCLLALSFTLALHEVSGFDAILFIDTPVARASDVNRRNFANFMSDVSLGKQIIMTFAPDEYSADINGVIRPIASSSVRLVLKDERYVEIEKETK